MDAVVSKPFRQEKLMQEIARWVSNRHDSAVDQDELSD
jgi:CheY-like chemotaxis protein